MKRILVLTEGNIYSRKGFFNAVVNRTRYLKDLTDYKIDILLLTTYEPWLIRRLRHTKKYARPYSFYVDGLEMKIDWRKFSLIDYILSVKFHKGTFFQNFHNSRIAKTLSNYDLIIAHSFDCGLVAKRVKLLYGTPYMVTWHGSDIHTAPFENSLRMKDTVNIIENADINFFVSKALMETSDLITTKGKKQILYNGANETFKQFSDKERKALRVKFKVDGKKVVVFAGGFLSVKNILLIPLIFRKIYSKYKNVEFWMIGDGKFSSQVRNLSTGLPVRFWGNQEPESMPDFLNASDVLILPSINEGLPLIAIEALACGCNVVGSRVGGIPEVIGVENTLQLSDLNFVDNFAEKVLEFLLSSKLVKQELNTLFNWKSSAQLEYSYIKDILAKSN